MALTVIIDDVFPQLLGSCPIHFAMQGNLTNCGDRCGLIDMTGYQVFRNSFTFEPFTYCFACGCPNDKARHHYFSPGFHQVEWYKAKAKCPYAHYLFKAIYALWFRDDLRPSFCRALDIHADSEEEFTEWAIQDFTNLVDREYFNGMSLMLWYCRHLGLYH